MVTGVMSPARSSEGGFLVVCPSGMWARSFRAADVLFRMRPSESRDAVLHQVSQPEAPDPNACARCHAGCGGLMRRAECP